MNATDLERLPGVIFATSGTFDYGNALGVGLRVKTTYFPEGLAYEAEVHEPIRSRRVATKAEDRCCRELERWLREGVEEWETLAIVNTGRDISKAARIMRRIGRPLTHCEAMKARFFSLPDFMTEEKHK